MRKSNDFVSNIQFCRLLAPNAFFADLLFSGFPFKRLNRTYQPRNNHIQLWISFVMMVRTNQRRSTLAFSSFAMRNFVSISSIVFSFSSDLTRTRLTVFSFVRSRDLHHDISSVSYILSNCCASLPLDFFCSVGGSISNLCAFSVAFSRVSTKRNLS